MSSPKKKFLYKAFDLLIASEIPILYLCELETDQSPDVEIIFGVIPEAEQMNQAAANYFVVQEEALILKFAGVGLFRVEQGRLVTVQSLMAQTESNVLGTLSTYLMGSVLGAVLHQRGCLVLHGNAIVHEDKAYIFAGESGAGKSTLAAAFAKAGCLVLSDDVSVIQLDEQGQPWVIPAYPAMKLWRDAAEYFQIGTETCHPVVMREHKFHVPYVDTFCHEKKKLEAVYFLEKKVEKFHVKKLGPVERIQACLLHTYVKRYSDVMGLSAEHLKRTALLAKTCDMYGVDYPHYRDCQEALIKLISPTLVNKIKERECCDG